MKKLSRSLEDYLKAMVLLGGTPDQSLHPADIAREVEVSKTSVGKALTALREHNLIVQPYYGEATLTQEGYEYGLAMVKRHNYLIAFLVQELGIDPDVAAEEAHLMEHAISDESFEKWVDYIISCGIEVH